jgi:hypothetical protein
MNALLLILMLADGASLPGTWKGRISDLKCGAMVDAACNRRCIEEGQQAVLVEDETGEIRRRPCGSQRNLQGRPDQRPGCETTGQIA